MEMDSKDHIAFCREHSLWQSYVNVDDGALLLNIKKWTRGQLEMDREEDKEEKFLSQGFDLSGHVENKDCAIGLNIQLRYGGTNKLDDPKVWEGSSEFRPWMSQICVNNEDPSFLLLTLEMEGITFKEDIKAGFAGEILGSEAMEKEKDVNPFSGLNESCDPGMPKELKRSTAHGLSSGLAEELKPLTGLVSLDPGKEKITLSSGPVRKSAVGRKSKKRSHEEAATVDLGKLRKELSTATAQLQPEGKKKRDLITGEVGALNKDATSSPPLEKEQEDVTKNREEDRTLVEDVMHSSSCKKKKEVLDLNPGEVRHKVLDEGARSSPSVAEKKEENSKKLYKGSFAMEYERCPKIGKLLLWIVANLLTLASKKEIWKLFICFRIIVSQVEGCELTRVVDKVKFLHPSATCNTHLENPISCKENVSLVCLYSVPNDTLAWGCAPDICLNGNVCPEWNILPNGSYVVQGGRGNCSGCPPFYHLSQLLNREFEKCYNSSQKYYPRSTVAPTTESTVAPTTESTVAPTTESTGAPTTESTGAPTTKNMQALSTGGIVGIALGLLAVIGAFSIAAGICIRKKRQVYKNPPTPDGEGGIRMTEPLQIGLNGSTVNGEDIGLG